MECPLCGGNLQPGVAPSHKSRNGYHLIFDQVPAMICEQCKTPLHDLEVVEILGQALDALDEVARKLKTVLPPDGNGAASSASDRSSGANEAAQASIVHSAASP